MTSTVGEITSESCRPNIAEAGIRRRRQMGHVSTVIGLVVLAALMAWGAPWYTRAVLFLPAAGAAQGYLQARRQTCVGHAMKGTIEHEDLSATPAPPDENAASRKVAATINRDAVLIGVGVAIVGMASALLH